MTSIQTKTPITPEDALQFQGEGGVEYVHGQLVEKPVSIESSEIEVTIAALLRAEAVKTRGARVFPSSMGYQCFRDDPIRFRKPDVSVVRADRLAGIDPSEGFIPIPPDLAVEVLSPNDLACDVAETVDDYLQNGFPLVWIVHPNTRSVVIHRAGGAVALLHETDEITAEPALPGFRCKVAELLATPA